MYLVYVDFSPAKHGLPLLCKKIKTDKDNTILVDIIYPPSEIESDYFSMVASLWRDYTTVSESLKTTTEVSFAPSEDTILFKSLKVSNNRIIAIFEVYGGISSAGVKTATVPVISNKDWYKDIFTGDPEAIVRGEEIYKGDINIDRQGILKAINEAMRLQRRGERREERQEQGEE